MDDDTEIFIGIPHTHTIRQRISGILYHPLLLLSMMATTTALAITILALVCTTRAQHAGVQVYAAFQPPPLSSERCDFTSYPNITDCDGYKNASGIIFTYPPRGSRKARETYSIVGIDGGYSAGSKCADLTSPEQFTEMGVAYRVGVDGKHYALLYLVGPKCWYWPRLTGREIVGNECFTLCNPFETPFANGEYHGTVSRLQYGVAPLEAYDCRDANWCPYVPPGKDTQFHWYFTTVHGKYGISGFYPTAWAAELRGCSAKTPFVCVD